MRRFATDQRIKVALLSVTAAGTGLDFSAASHVVFAELPHEVRLRLGLLIDVPTLVLGALLALMVCVPSLLQAQAPCDQHIMPGHMPVIVLMCKATYLHLTLVVQYTSSNIQPPLG